MSRAIAPPLVSTVIMPRALDTNQQLCAMDLQPRAVMLRRK